MIRLAVAAGRVILAVDREPDADSPVQLIVTIAEGDQVTYRDEAGQMRIDVSVWLDPDEVQAFVNALTARKVTQ